MTTVESHGFVGVFEDRLRLRSGLRLRFHATTVWSACPIDMRSFFVAALLVAVPAYAEPVKTPDVHSMHTDDCARARKQNKTCVIDMGKGDTVDGTTPTAGGSTTSVIEFPKTANMIHLRRDFIVEILKTAEDL